MLDREEYDRFRVAPLDPATLRARDVERLLKKLVDGSGGRLKVEKFAESIEGRPIYFATIGSGPRRVLLWSQMHGDEPTHTAVLLDLTGYLLQSPAKPLADDILRGCTLHFIAMLNPDGAEAVMRYNAQGIDINRDARRLATPEGRALRHAVDRVKPQFGFNLHNQHARTTVGKPPKPAAVSVLAPAPDFTGRETPSWRRAKQMCAVFVEAVRPIIPGMISRYDDTHEPRAFGDTIQATGASTMLVEAGGWTDA
ncbi:MAG TPA: M14 family zinc carboxypeptidase, partial [Lacipirellulaceae bacterium]|nr:M14 family zinc carboxypeptidase [Lacipirellulaceae bacterium]